MPFLQTVAHSPFQSKEPKLSQNKLLLGCYVRVRTHTHTHIQSHFNTDSKDVCLTIQLWKGDCSRLTVQLKKKIPDQVSACAQRENKEWKHQKKSVAGGLVCKLSVSLRLAASKPNTKALKTFYTEPLPSRCLWCLPWHPVWGLQQANQTQQL